MIPQDKIKVGQPVWLAGDGYAGYEYKIIKIGTKNFHVRGYSDRFGESGTYPFPIAACGEMKVFLSAADYRAQSQAVESKDATHAWITANWTGEAFRYACGTTRINVNEPYLNYFKMNGEDVDYGKMVGNGPCKILYDGILLNEWGETWRAVGPLNGREPHEAIVALRLWMDEAMQAAFDRQITNLETMKSMLPKRKRGPLIDPNFRL